MIRSTLLFAGMLVAVTTTGTEPLTGPRPAAAGVALAESVEPVATAMPAATEPGGVLGAVRTGVEVVRDRPLVFLALSVVGIVLFAPGSAFTLAAGLAYGLWAGLALSLAATMAAAMIHFVLARHFLRGPVRRRLAGRRRFEALERVVTKDGWKIVGLTRVSALVPGAIQNCLYALTAVRFRTFIAASLIGLIPPTLLFAAAGSTGGGFLSAGSGAVAPLPPWGRVASLVVLGLTVAYLAVRARHELARTG